MRLIKRMQTAPELSSAVLNSTPQTSPEQVLADVISILTLRSVGYLVMCNIDLPVNIYGCPYRDIFITAVIPSGD